MADTMCRRRLALLLVFYLLDDFAGPFLPGAVRVEAGEGVEAAPAARLPAAAGAARSAPDSREASP